MIRALTQRNSHWPKLLRRSAGVAALLSTVLLPLPASAQAVAAEPTGSTEAPAAAAPTTVRLQLSMGDSALQAEAIERALEEELGVAVEQTAESGNLEIALQAGRVTARTKASGGRTVERSMQLPAREDEQLQVIALLSENLLRDEAGALLNELAESAPEPPAAAGAVAVGAAAASATPAPASDPAKAEEANAERAEAEKKEEEFGPITPAGLAFTRDVEIPGKEASVAFALAVPDGQWKSIRGLGISAFLLSSTGRSQGLSIAAAMHEAGAFDGLSIAGLYDGTKSEHGGFHGLRITGLYSYSAGNMYGLQISGLAGLTKKRSIGLQIAPYNHSGDATASVQIGVVNYSEKGGTQIGVVNVHRKGQSSKVGPVGFGPGTRQQFVAWVQGTNLTYVNDGMPYAPTGNVGFRIQSQYVTTMVHVGLGAESSSCAVGISCGTGEVLFIPGYTIGARLPVSKVWSFELDMQHRFTGGYELSFLNHMVAIRGSVVARVHPLIAVFAAAGPEIVLPGGWADGVQEHISLGVQVL